MSTPDEQTGRPLTRRELRELRAKGSAAVDTAGEAAEPAEQSAPEPATNPAPEATPDPEPAPAEPAASASEPSAPEPVAPAHPPLTRKEMRQLRTNEVPVVAAEPDAGEQPITQPDSPVSTTVFEMPRLDPAFGAGLGTAASRENASFDALMEQSPTTSPSSILMTSSHRLPAGVGSTGAAHGTTDGRDIDAVLLDRELPASSSPTPIAASSAISTQKSAAEVLRPPSPEKGRSLLLVLGITAGALGIVAVGTLATLYFTGAFN